MNWIGWPAAMPWLLFAGTGCFLAFVIWKHGITNAALDQSRGECSALRQHIAGMETRLRSLGHSKGQSDSRSKLVLAAVLRVRTEFVQVLAERDYLRSKADSGTDPEYWQDWIHLTVGEQAEYVNAARKYLDGRYGAKTT